MSYWYFPCVQGGKQPALEGDWRGHATQDQAIIDGWLDAGYNLAVDCERSGLCVIDLDGGEIGEATWQRLQAEHVGVVETHAIRTPRGGRHLYYAGTAPSSVQRLGAKVDTRGQGGYVLVPPSATADGAYQQLNVSPVAALPDWVRHGLSTSTAVTAAVVEDLDTAANLTRARLWLQDRAPAVEGRGGDDWTYQTACGVLDLGVSPERAVDLMLEHWNERCDPPWEPEALALKVENAASYQQNEGGAWAVGDPVSRFSGAVGVSVETPVLPNPYKLWRVSEALARPEPQWLFPGVLPREVLCLLYGLPEAGKSWIALDICLHVASGKIGWGRPQCQPEDVIFFCGEGFADLAHNRIVAWCKHHAVPVDSISERLRLLENFPPVTDGQELKLLSDAINAEHIRPALIVLDTYARVMAESGLGENDPKEVMAFVREAERIKRGFRCTVMPIHHSGKEVERGARGSNSLIAAVDCAFEMIAHWGPRAFELSCAKMKIAAKPDPLHFEAKIVPPGLIFEPIEAAEYKALTVATGALDDKAIGAALASAGIRGHDRAIHTSNLASLLYQGPTDETPDAAMAGKERLTRKLTSRARHSVYAEKEQHGVMWALPG